VKRGQLAEVCLTITKGTTPTTLGMNYSDSGVPFIRVNNFPTGVLRLNDDILFVSEATHRMLSRSVIRPRDVLLSIAGTIGESAKRVTDGTHQSPNWSETGVPFLFVSNIRGRQINFQTSKFISDDEYQRLTARCPIETGDIRCARNWSMPD